MGGARVDRDDDAVLEDETERGGAVVGLDVIDNLALELVVLRMDGRGEFGQGSAGQISARAFKRCWGATLEGKFDVARGAPGVIRAGGRTFSTMGSLKFCA